MKIIGARIRDIHSLCNIMEKQNERGERHLKVIIPHYQRPYTWGNAIDIDAHGDLIANLIQDFFNNYDKEKENTEDKDDHNTYFTGMIIAVKNKEREAYNIIDGQQRLTTIFLLNIISFICRVNYINHLFKEETFGKYETELNDFCDFYVNNICADNINEIENLKKDVEEAVLEKDVVKMTKKLADRFKNVFPIDFKKENYQESFKKFLYAKTLSLDYEYSHYNELLKDAVSRVRIYISDNDIELDILPNIGDDDNISESYVNALSILFENIKENLDVNEDKNLFQLFAERIKIITDNLKVCLLLAENEEDAYTLFEVVNDRSMPLETIDLIKNMFYRQYVSDSKGNEKVEDIDKHIGTLNEKWNKSFEKLGKDHRDFVLLIAISYITSSYINSKDDKSYKNAIKDYFEKNSRYEYKNIEKDFNVISDSAALYKMFYGKSSVKKISVNKMALRAELDNTTHLFYKVFHMLRAFKQDNVIPALTNTILGQFYSEKKKNGILKIEEFFEKIKNCEWGTNREIDCVSKDLNKLALLGKNYETVLKYAKEKIQNSKFKLTEELCNEAEEQYVEWMNEWKKGTNDIRIKILFNRLYAFENNKGNLEVESISHHLKTEKQELDHLDARKQETDLKEFYYTPLDGTIRRDIIDSLGNMMILDKGLNIKKSNSYLESGLGEYEKKYKDGSGNPHWLVTEIKDLLDKYHIKVKKGKKEVKVPTKDFFSKRKERLINYFRQVIYKSEQI